MATGQAQSAPQSNPGDNRPVPDPTALTTQQIIASISCLKEIIETRLDGMDKAIELLQDMTNKFPAHVTEKVMHLKELHNERFSSVANQFLERDTREKRTSEDGNKAIAAALQAAKEAVGEQNKSSGQAIGKSEAATDKRIDGQAVLLQTATKALDEKINDLRERLTRIDGKTEGARNIGGYIFAAIGALVGIGGIIIAVTMR